MHIAYTQISWGKRMPFFTLSFKIVIGTKNFKEKPEGFEGKHKSFFSFPGIECREITSTAHLMVDCTNDNLFESECAVSCEEGYQLSEISSPVRVCQANGLFDGTPGACTS